MDIPASETAKWAGRHGQAHVMLVDDDPSVLSALRRLLEISGYCISAFADGHQAVRFFQERSRGIELVLLDMIMPRVSGQQVFYELRRIDPAVNVLFISGYSESQTLQDLLAHERTGFLQKPFAIGKLLEIMSDFQVSRATAAC